MKVLEKLTEMVSTGLTGVPLILGTDLLEIMKLVIAEINYERDLYDKKPIDYNMHEDWYSYDFYNKLWYEVLRPVTFKYINETRPNAWYLKCYAGYYETN